MCVEGERGGDIVGERESREGFNKLYDVANDLKETYRFRLKAR